MTVHQAKHLLKSIGLSLAKKHGEYRINFLGAGESTAYYTTDLADAVGTAKRMALRRDGGGMRRNPLKYGVFEWTDKYDGWYRAEDAIKVYTSLAAAERYAKNRNLVVRSQHYVRGEL